jgi:hypothetical protein
VFASKDRLVQPDRRELPLVDVAHVHGKIEVIPGALHPAMGEEKSVDLVRVGAVERRAAFNALPIGKPRVEHAMHNDVGERAVIGMNAAAFSAEDDLRTMGSDQARHRHSHGHRIGQQPVEAIEHEALDSEGCRRPKGLVAPDVRLGITGRLAVGQIDEEHAKSLCRELGRGAAHRHVEIVWMGTEPEDVVSHHVLSIEPASCVPSRVRPSGQANDLRRACGSHRCPQAYSRQGREKFPATADLSYVCVRRLAGRRGCGSASHFVEEIQELPVGDTRSVARLASAGPSVTDGLRPRLCRGQHSWE